MPRLMPAAAAPTASDTRAPCASPAATSRPSESLPRKKAASCRAEQRLRDHVQRIAGNNTPANSADKATAASSSMPARAEGLRRKARQADARAARPGASSAWPGAGLRAGFNKAFKVMASRPSCAGSLGQRSRMRRSSQACSRSTSMLATITSSEDRNRMPSSTA